MMGFVVVPMVKRVLWLSLPLLLLLATPPAAAAQVGIVSVDYVIGMVEAGLDQHAIIEHILKNKLAFRLSEKSLERLREAGAGEELLEVVRERAATTRDDWERPRRLGEYGDIWSDGGEGEAYREEGGGSMSYGGYVYFGPWYGFYPGIYAYSYYDPFSIYYPYYPYYRPYSYYSYYYPYHRYPHLRHGDRGQIAHPRGFRPTTPRGSPPMGRSSGGGRTRTAPRGSH